MTCFFASDLHGDRSRYAKLFARIRAERPAAVFLGGDLLPSGFGAVGDLPGERFVEELLGGGLAELRRDLGAAYPPVFAILGNDDPRSYEEDVRRLETRGLLTYVHDRTVPFGQFAVRGYVVVPPTPFGLKDWELYDVSRFVGAGCVSPEEGWRSTPVEPHVVRWATIAKDLARIAGDEDQSRSIWLFHAPPYQTTLDRAALDGKMIDYHPLDVHVGSIAVRRFIEARGPAVTLHGHVHESARITGAWRDRLGGAEMFGAAHDGPELALVSFDPARPRDAARRLL